MRKEGRPEAVFIKRILKKPKKIELCNRDSEIPKKKLAYSTKQILKVCPFGRFCNSNFIFPMIAFLHRLQRVRAALV